MSHATRAVWLRDGGNRDEPENRNTVFLGSDLCYGPACFQERFKGQLSLAQPLLQASESPGVIVTAVDEHGLAGAAFLAAQPDRVSTVVIGRHSETDLSLGDDPSLSLRQAMLIIHPAATGKDLRYRIVDLHTATAFKDEHGRRLEAIEAEGPAFIGCGRYVLYFFPTDSLLVMTDDKDQAWDCVPARVYLQECLAAPERWRQLQHEEKTPPPTQRRAHEVLFEADTWVRWGKTVELLGPAIPDQSLVDEDEEVLGELRIRCGAEEKAIFVGPKAAARGILLGRHPRSDVQLLHRNISRVHLLVIRIAARLYGLDTGSTSGVLAGGASMRVAPLDEQAELTLAVDAARVRWVANN